MRFSGERCDGFVYLVLGDRTGHIKRVSREASSALVSELRTSVCDLCPVFDVECRGAGKVENTGRLLEKSTDIPIRYAGCTVPASPNISVLTGGIEIESLL